MCVCVRRWPALTSSFPPPHQLRTSRNFCLDVTLLCILLALALYIYKVVAKK